MEKKEKQAEGLSKFSLGSFDVGDTALTVP